MAGASTNRSDRGWIKLAVGIAAIAVAVVVARRLGVFELLSASNLDRLDAWFAALGPWAPAVYVTVWVLAALFFLPGLPVTIVGGLVFGPIWGTVWTTVGANLGAAAAFLVGRHLARDLVERRIASSGSLRRIDDGVRRNGWRMLLVTRLVPIFPFNIQNYAYGLTDIPLATYVLVNLPSMLPATIAYSFAAGSVRTGRIGTALWYLGIAAVCFVGLSLLPSWLSSKLENDELRSQDRG